MMKPCPLDKCDGSGMLDGYILKTIKRHPSGSVFTKKERITRQQSLDLTSKIDWKDQTIAEIAIPCECRKEFQLK